MRAPALGYSFLASHTNTTMTPDLEQAIKELQEENRILREAAKHVSKEITSQLQSGLLREAHHYTRVYFGQLRGCLDLALEGKEF